MDGQQLCGPAVGGPVEGGLRVVLQGGGSGCMGEGSD